MKFPKLLVAAFVLGTASVANAAPITWNYSGTGSCTFGCTGAVTVTGTLVGDPTAFGLNDILSALDGISYSWNMSGAISESYSGTVASGGYNVNSAGQITGGSMTFGDAFALEFLDVGAANWSFVDRRVGIFQLPLVREASGQGGYTSVPEPGTLALLGLGLAGLGMVRRKRAA